MNRQSIHLAILKNLSNIPGWRTNRKLITLESDDWGGIRMPSALVFERLIKGGIDLISDDGYRFNKLDSLATREDLASLFDVLFSIKDSTGRHSVLTPISVVANPDFKKINLTNFTEYYFEPFTETLNKYSGCEDSFSLWKEGIEKRIFVPQFHGREHLNVKVWMRALKEKHKKTMLAFNNNMWGISTATDPEIRTEFQAAFDFLDPDDLKYQEEVIKTGLSLFEKLFQYRATYFVPPNGPFSSRLESLCSKHGIKYLSVSKIQTEPLGHGKTKKRLHWLGQRTNSGLIRITRNCFFEPSQSEGGDWIDKCLNDISTAFKWNKPAVISSHRVNYIGAIEKKNRDTGLRSLDTLLKKIMKIWPETEFVTSAELGDIISNG
jgi:hypothetical protein